MVNMAADTPSERRQLQLFTVDSAGVRIQEQDELLYRACVAMDETVHLANTATSLLNPTKDTNDLYTSSLPLSYPYSLVNHHDTPKIK